MIVPALHIFVFSITIVDIICPRHEYICIQYYDFRSHSEKFLGTVYFTLLDIFVQTDGAKVLHVLFVTSIAFSWSPLSWVSAPFWYYKNMVVIFVWYRLVLFNSFWRFISIYPVLKLIDKQQHHSTALLYYYLETTKRQYFIWCQKIVMRNIVILIKFVWFSNIRHSTTVTNPC